MREFKSCDDVEPQQSAGQRVREYLAKLPRTIVGGLPIVVLNRRATAELMIDVALELRGGNGPILMSSANGEVLSRCGADKDIARVFLAQDLISADGQAMVHMSRLLCGHPLPERVATTDLFHDVAPLMAASGLTCYMYGATLEENARAVANVRRMYPGLKIVGQSHGYHQGESLEAKIKEINALAPDVLWLALGVPREQEFALTFAEKLNKVGIVKTAGGLFNFLSGSRTRAPHWMQQAGFEWAWRIKEEPRRLFARYAETNFHAMRLIIMNSR